MTERKICQGSRIGSNRFKLLYDIVGYYKINVGMWVNLSKKPMFYASSLGMISQYSSRKERYGFNPRYYRRGTYWLDC